MNPMHFIVKSSFIIALIAISSFYAHADDYIRFRQVSHEATYAKVSCMSFREVSKSLNTKYTQRFRTYLNPRQVGNLVHQRQYIELDRLVTAARVKAHGDQALASLQKTQIAVQIKTTDHKTLSTSLFQWSDESPDAWHEVDKANVTFDFADQGKTDCSVTSPRDRNQTCYFDAYMNTQNQLERQSMLLAKYHDKNPEQGLIIEVLYRHSVFVDCVGKRSQAFVGGSSSKPILYLRDR